MDYGDADTPLARWLRARIGDTKLREIERRSRRAGVAISASLLSSYLHGETTPDPRTQRKLATFFGVSLGELAAIVAETDGLAPGAQAVLVDEPPAWMRELMDRVKRIERTGEKILEGHAGRPGVLSPGTRELGAALAEVGHPGLAPVEAPNDLPPHVLAGMVVWIDTAIEPSRGAAVYVERGAERLLGRVAADGVGVVVPGEPAAIGLDDGTVRVLGVARLAQIPLWPES